MLRLRPVAAGLVVLFGAAVVGLVAPSPAGATEVGTEQELRDAFADPAETLIELTADITIDCADYDELLRDNPDEHLRLEGGGHTITFPCEAGNASLFVVGDDATQLSFSIVDVHLVDTGSGYAAAFVDGQLFIDHVETDGWGDVFRGDEVSVGYSYVHDALAAGIRSDAEAFVHNSTFARMEDGVRAGGDGDTEVAAANSTFSDISGAAFQVRSTATQVSHVTFEGNGTHVSQTGGSLDSAWSAYGTSAEAPCAFSGGATVTGGYNVVVGDCGFTDEGDVADATPSQLALSTLSGTPTPVHTPGSASILIDAIPAGDFCLPDDQIDTPRPQGDGCDVGAIEVIPASSPDPTPGPDPAPRPATPAAVAPTFTG